MKEAPSVGLLPFYLALYDKIMPQIRRNFDPFLKSLAEVFRQMGIWTAVADVTCTKAECRAAVNKFLSEDVDAIVTLHLAYSLSLETADVLCRSGLPVIMLDTTMDYSFGRATPTDRIMYNHGIHGVMDLASVLVRRSCPFEMVAGHFLSERRVQERTAELVRAAAGARNLKRTSCLLVGEPFRGMGDFSVSNSSLQKWGYCVRKISLQDVENAAAKVSESELRHEIAEDRRNFHCEVSVNDHWRAVRVGLGIRRLIHEFDCNAFSFNFLTFNRKNGAAATVPFLEASKGMKRGIGYAGEGDVLTAGLVGALQRSFGRTTFTEIFCPDWKGGSLFLSHMGEINPDVSAEKPRLVLKDYPFSNAMPPVICVCTAQAGPAVFVNLSPCPEGQRTLIVAPVTVLGDATSRSMKQIVRTWIKPVVPVRDFLEEYSLAGGTHHSALVLGSVDDAIASMGRFLNIRVVRIGNRK